jgi:hypothetical protein
MKNIHKINQHIYITCDEEIKEGDIDSKVCIFKSGNGIITCLAGKGYGRVKTFGKYYEVILTTDQDLIKDGVQIVKGVGIESFNNGYKIIIPKEEPKLTNVCIKCGVDLYYADNFACQEHPKSCKGIHLSEETLKERALKEEPKQETTLEEVAEKFYPGVDRQVDRMLFIKGAKWQQEQDKNKYSEEEVLEILFELSCNSDTDKEEVEEWFEQFKKK